MQTPTITRKPTLPTERRAVSNRIPASGLNLANPEKVDLSNALNLMGVCKEAYTEYTHFVGHTQFHYRDHGDHQVISYSGSKELKDWGHDANIMQMKCRDMGWVHSGFAKAYDVVPRIPKINYHHVGESFFLTTSGKIEDRQQSAWSLWPWQVPGQRVSSHHLPNYMANLRKFLG